MSLASGAGSGCCVFTGGDAIPIQNPSPCGQTIPDCDDLLSAAIGAILRLGTRGGATVSETLDQVINACPDFSDVTTTELQYVMDRGARQGSLRRVNRDGDTAYMVIAGMVQLNSANKRYMRPICAMYSARGNGTLTTGTYTDPGYVRCDQSPSNAYDCRY